MKHEPLALLREKVVACSKEVVAGGSRERLISLVFKASNVPNKQARAQYSRNWMDLGTHHHLSDEFCVGMYELKPFYRQDELGITR